MAHSINHENTKKIPPLTVPKIMEQLECALMEIKNNQKAGDEEMIFNKIENVPIESKRYPRSQFIGKELMLFEMMAILNGKIAELQKKYDKLKSIEEKEEVYLSVNSNEIISRIQKIFDYARLARTGHVDQKEAWDGVLEVAKKLQYASTVILDTNRVASDNLKLTKQMVNINNIVSEVVETGKSCGPKVPIRVGLDQDIEIPVDKIRLCQVLQTILNNSINSTESGHIKVECLVAHEQNVVIIRINDTGKRIPKEILSKIFEKDATESEFEERGEAKLSLYLCNGIIKTHGGLITAKNNEGPGCTFTITLPIKEKEEHLH